MTDERTFTLFSDGLLSKWGFSDGDEPDHVADWLEADGIPYADIPWRAVLRQLVREHLVPALDQQVVVYDIETNHNPIRAETVDGIKVDDYGDNPLITLTPESVAIPYADVLAITRRIFEESTMQIGFQQHADPSERYAPGCFDSSIGKELPLTVGGQTCGRCTVLAANVAEDGLSVSLTVRVPDEASGYFHLANRSEFSFGPFVSHGGDWPREGAHVNFGIDPVEAPIRPKL